MDKKKPINARCGTHWELWASFDLSKWSALVDIFDSKEDAIKRVNYYKTAEPDDKRIYLIRPITYGEFEEI